MFRPSLHFAEGGDDDEEQEEDEDVDDSLSASPDADVKIIFPEHQDLCASRNCSWS